MFCVHGCVGQATSGDPDLFVDQYPVDRPSLTHHALALTDIGGGSLKISVPPPSADPGYSRTYFLAVCFRPPPSPRGDHHAIGSPLWCGVVWCGVVCDVVW